MSTQAHILINNNHKYQQDMIWINHDAYPEIIIPLIEKSINEKTTPETILKQIIETLLHETSGHGSFYTLEESKLSVSSMNYKYIIEFKGEDLYLRTMKEHWIEQSDEFPELPGEYLSSEMRTIKVQKIKRKD